jgi:REP element-mobilizing transposase RayT
MAYYSCYYHLIFCTKKRQLSLIKEVRPALFAVMGGKLKEMKSRSILINGVEDHVHLLLQIHPSVQVSLVVQKVKLAASVFLKDRLNGRFKGWQAGYAVLTFDKSRLNGLIHYVENQEAHHRKQSFIDELSGLLLENDIEFDERYLE